MKNLLIKSYGWREWICHTNFSFLIGASHPKDLIQRAIQYGYSGLGVTDYDGVYGIARSWRELEKEKKDGKNVDGFKLYFGAEIHLSQDHHLPCYFQDTLIIFALNRQGYYNLCRLLTYSHRNGKKDAYIPLDYLLQAQVYGLLALQPMRGLIRREEGRNFSFMKDRFEKIKEHFNGDFYFVVSRHLNQAEDFWIMPTVHLAKSMGCGILLSQDVYFHDPDQKKVSDLLTAIRCNQPIDKVSDQLFINAGRSLQSLDYLEKIYSPLSIYESALKEGRKVEEMFDFDLKELKYSYPSEMIPQGFTAQSYLEHLVWKHAFNRYGGIPEKIKGSLKHELCLVSQLGFADYFLTVYDIVKWARSQEILCQGRGSAANSAICFVLGITSVDPNKFELLFERFISVERGDPPDIDVDFEHERREEVIQYIYERFGRKRAAMVCNVICFKSRGAIRFSGKALGVPDKILEKTALLLEKRPFRSNEASETIVSVREECEALWGRGVIGEHIWLIWGEMAEKIRGFPRHLGIHSGGFILSDKSIDWLCPQEPATMGGRTVIEWCKEDIEGLGFFKIDVLALGGLTLIRKCLDLIASHYGRKLTLDAIPDPDLKTYQMIQKADTVGTFQIESRAQMSFLPRHKPANFYDLVVQVAIIRPGPIQGGMIHPYLRRRKGEEPVSFPDPRLIPILKRTYGVPIFQEQIMRIAIAVGGFSPGEADELRKNIGAFAINMDTDLWVEKLAIGMRKNGIAEAFIQAINEHIKGFASYGFPESHAASFALLAYATAYLKCHYPAVFFTALLNSQPMGFYGIDILLKTAKRLGVSVLPICVKFSNWDHKLEKIDGKQEDFIYAIRLGFRIVKGLSESGMKRLVIQRCHEEKTWNSIEEFLRNSSLSRQNLTALAAAGALHSFGVERKSALWLAEASPYQKWIEVDDPRVSFQQETTVESVQLDYMATSTSLGKHPAELMKEHAWGYTVSLKRVVLSSMLPHIKFKERIVVFGMVTCRQAPPTAKGVLFITLWDETGSLDLIVHPQIYERYSDMIDLHSFLCAEGVLQRNDGGVSILVKKFFVPEDEGRSKPPRREEKPIHGKKLHSVRNYR